MKKLLAVLLLVPAAALYAAGARASEVEYRLDRAPINPNDLASLQSGARTFVNYCLNCHGAQFMRYNRLRDLGLSELQIKDNLMFAGDKVGETMKVALDAKDGKAWFGVAPPDLSVISRSRGVDWLYTYLRSFYRDPTTATGWNNAVFPNVAMPNVLWKLQGERAMEVVRMRGEGGHDTVEYKWSRLSEGALTQVEYDRTVRDLVNFLAYVGEPAAQTRKTIGIWALFVLSVLFVLAYALKREYWKDVK
jgi:ubiquinol-cytochrome c reductase cytochrome c1 subunit